MTDPAEHRKRARWVFLAAVLAGGLLWWTTGHWQWFITILALPYIGLAVYVFNRPVHSHSALRGLRASKAERLADVAAHTLLAGVLVWCAWSGMWWLAIVGVIGSLVTLVITSIRQDRRRGREQSES